MNITIQNIYLDENYGEELKSFVPFRSFPVRSEDSKYRTRLLNHKKHPFWAWVTYIAKEPFKISIDRESFSSIIDVALHDVEQFAVDYDEIRITFADGTAVSFELPIERYSHISIDAAY